MGVIWEVETNASFFYLFLIKARYITNCKETKTNLDSIK
jgi:hypothetical protein